MQLWLSFPVIMLAAFELYFNEAEAGSTFVVWGGKSCPGSDNELVYVGFAGGKPYTQKGSATNRLCLTNDPVFNLSMTIPNSHGWVFGAEYGDIPDMRHHDVPCALCKNTLSTTIMIPGTRYCPHRWTLQYEGFLVSEHQDHSGSEYVCLTEDYTAAESGKAKNDYGNLFYFVLNQCGSLPCPPYSKSNLVFCVVCSR